jgi:hypothetical protein
MSSPLEIAPVAGVPSVSAPMSSASVPVETNWLFVLSLSRTLLNTSLRMMK